MREVDAHVAEATALVSTLAPVTLPLREAFGTVAASDQEAQVPSPPFDNSAMDGYAVRAAEVVGATAAHPVRLPVAGESAAGAAPATLPPASAWRIMTGAPVPVGADAIVPVEHTDGALDTVSVLAASESGRHVRRAGEDALPGDVVLSRGEVLTATRIAALAAVGVAQVPTVSAPRVAVLATGDELVDAGARLGPGQIHDSNAVLLEGLVREAGAVPVLLERVGDRPEQLLERLSGVDADLIVTTGGVSVGAYDVVKAALADRGVEFSAVAMQPGKPQGLGRFEGTPIACLPGNPVSVLVSFAVIVAPMIRRLRGLDTADAGETAVAASGWRTPQGRRQFMPVRFVSRGTVAPATAGGSGSHLIASLARAQALADVAAGVDQVEPGATVRIVRWDG
ncbi:molybdopterin molybdotransferase MoeA [Demequina activiva]|uniref:Molybdopterin molybdenumtransferase n=1 Tax=Demequina activiva TaxID=1582364 RepID=A0A919Q6C6_9MICO|nr:gephyrin-like molybdotransferase Glp [Demequina activiva]GIG55053.1 molybdopterin molybdenumtransferase [Demequina activiva]